MPYQNRNFGSGRGRGDRDFNNRGFNRPTMHKTICSNCGKECEVPFRPTGEKPVYCRDCFREMGGADARRSEERQERNAGRPNFDNRNFEQKAPDNSRYQQDIAELNVKVDKILSILTAAISTETSSDASPDAKALDDKKAMDDKEEVASNAIENETMTDATSDIASEEIVEEAPVKKKRVSKKSL